MSTISSSEQTIFSASKLLKHLDRVVQFQTTGDSTPIFMGIDMTNVCNHRCPMCNGAPGEEENDLASLPIATMERLADDCAALGVKAVSFGGGGDASCHPQAAAVLRLFRSRGIETSLFTNAQRMTEELQEAITDCCTWVRISLDADGPEMFKKTHGMEPRDWEKVLDNVRSLVALRARKGSPIVIGSSFLIGSHTKSGIYGAAQVAREIGVDYIRMRPFFTWNGDLPFARAEADEVLKELDRAQELSTESFLVSYPKARTEWVQERGYMPKYKKCRIHHFITEVNANGAVHLCCHTKYKDKYKLGDLNTQSLVEIWNSERRKEVYQNIDYNDCAMPCKLSMHNELLESIEGDVVHPNFL